MNYSYPEELYVHMWDDHAVTRIKADKNLAIIADHTEKEIAIYRLVKIQKVKIESNVVARDI